MAYSTNKICTFYNIINISVYSHLFARNRGNRSVLIKNGNGEIVQISCPFRKKHRCFFFLLCPDRNIINVSIRVVVILSVERRKKRQRCFFRNGQEIWTISPLPFFIRTLRLPQFRANKWEDTEMLMML